MEWFSSWFDSPYYHILYQHRDDKEAEFFIDNLINKFNINKENSLLDLACGKGRHSKYLAKTGALVTGLDLSEQSIAHAQQFSNDRLQFYVHDMRKYFRSNYYDYIFNFFTSFGYFDNDRDHHAVLKAINKGLKPNGIFVMDFMNAIKIIENLVPKEEKELDHIHFKINRKVEKNHTIVKSIRFKDKAQDYHFEERVRAFPLYELARMFRQNGLNIINIYGNYDLSTFSPYTSPRLILIAQKNA